MSKDATADRLRLFRAQGFATLQDRAIERPEIARAIAQHLRDGHRLNIRPVFVMRWLTTDPGTWQEPRYTVGAIILRWWKQNNRAFDQTCEKRHPRS